MSGSIAIIGSVPHSPLIWCYLWKVKLHVCRIRSGSAERRTMYQMYAIPTQVCSDGTVADHIEKTMLHGSTTMVHSQGHVRFMYSKSNASLTNSPTEVIASRQCFLIRLWSTYFCNTCALTSLQVQPYLHIMYGWLTDKKAVVVTSLM